MWIEVWVGMRKESLGVIKNGEVRGSGEEKAGHSQQRPGGLGAQLRLWSSSEKLRAVTPDSAPRQEPRRKKKLAGGCLPRGTQSSLLQAGVHSPWGLPFRPERRHLLQWDQLSRGPHDLQGSCP